MKTNTYSNSLKFLFNHLVKERKGPCFEVPDSRQILILTEPLDYYLAMNKLIENSRKRICMSALYLGTGKLEQYLLEKVDRQLQANEHLRVNMLFDYMRGTRTNSQGQSTYTMLKDLK